MEKPTIFFSHSSSDKKTILPIKDKLCSITSNVLDVFMSSDGQSIPFGNNWIHKIEEGLNKAQIMFVFVTPVSVNSAWIYFEAGFAYSKNIEVIPVGIGVSIGQLNPPLSLLQGFDITSTDSLNNFISIINRKFDLEFNYAFTDDTYGAVFASMTDYNNHINIGDIFKSANNTICSQCREPISNRIIRYDIDMWAKNIKDYLKENNIKFASYQSRIVVNGISVEIVGKEMEDFGNILHTGHNIIFNLSTQNFKQTFELYKELALNCLTNIEQITLTFDLYPIYDCLKRNVDISSIIANVDNDFDYIEDTVDYYLYNNKIRFKVDRVFNLRERAYEKTGGHITISFNATENVEYSDIISLFEGMIKCGLLFKQSNHQNVSI